MFDTWSSEEAKLCEVLLIASDKCIAVISASHLPSAHRTDPSSWLRASSASLWQWFPPLMFAFTWHYSHNVINPWSDPTVNFKLAHQDEKAPNTEVRLGVGTMTADCLFPWICNSEHLFQAKHEMLRARGLGCVTGRQNHLNQMFPFLVLWILHALPVLKKSLCKDKPLTQNNERHWERLNFPGLLKQNVALNWVFINSLNTPEI